MATAAVTNTFVASTPAKAAEVNTNFTNLVTFLNNSVVHRDGSKAMTAALDAGNFKLTNVADGVSATDAATKGQMDTAISTAITNVSRSKVVTMGSNTAISTGGTVVATYSITAVTAGVVQIFVTGTTYSSGVTYGDATARVRLGASLASSAGYAYAASTASPFGDVTQAMGNGPTTSFSVYLGSAALAVGANTVTVTFTRTNVPAASGGTLYLSSNSRIVLDGVY